jgi:uncharacterized membrane protein
MDTNSRSMAKAVSYRVLGSASTMGIVFLFSRDVPVSVGAGLLDFVVKVVLYFLHERLWNSISYGRPKPPEYEI